MVSLDVTPERSDPIGLLMAVDLQDHLMTAAHDLERLQTLLDDSHQAMQSGFFGVLELLEREPAAQGSPVTSPGASTHVALIVKALQFQDMASQLIAHTNRRLRNCTDRLARDAFAGDPDGDAIVEDLPIRPNPVTQSEMDTGFIELF